MQDVLCRTVSVPMQNDRHCWKAYGARVSVGRNFYQTKGEGIERKSPAFATLAKQLCGLACEPGCVWSAKIESLNRLNSVFGKPVSGDRTTVDVRFRIPAYAKLLPFDPLYTHFHPGLIEEGV